MNIRGFGVLPSFEHFFVVRIESDRTMVFEHLGGQGRFRTSLVVQRCVIPGSQWEKLAPVLEKEFNRRLSKKNLPMHFWLPGDNPVDRLLGRELCVLAKAVQDSGEADKSIREWINSTPEDRWSRFLN